MRKPAWLVFAAIAVLVAIVGTVTIVSRAPVAERQGTAPSVVTDSAGAEANPVGAPAPGQEARKADASSYSARAARGSGVEGVTSGGTTTDPPGR